MSSDVQENLTNEEQKMTNDEQKMTDDGQQRVTEPLGSSDLPPESCHIVYPTTQPYTVTKFPSGIPRKLPLRGKGQVKHYLYKIRWYSYMYNFR